MEGKGPLKPKRYDCVIFDLDGTLVTIPVDWQAARREVERVVGSGLDGAPLFPRLRSLTEGRPELRAEAFAALDRYESVAAQKARALPGAEEQLHGLSAGRRMGLVTMQGKRACSVILGRLGAGGLFGAVLTREDSLDRAEQLRGALAALGAEPASSIFVADKVSDAQAARDCGIDVAIVGRSSAVAPEPDYLLPGVSALGDVIA